MRCSHKRVAIILVLVCLAGAGARLVSAALEQGTATVSAPTLMDLSWFVGDWQMSHERVTIEEHWIPAKGGLMLGLSRTVSGGRAVAFEFLRIEERENGIYYVAQPKGRPPTDFKLIKLEDKAVVFENPDHDFPRIIRYQLKSDGTLLAQIEGKLRGKVSTQSFAYRPLSKK